MNKREADQYLADLASGKRKFDVFKRNDEKWKYGARDHQRPLFLNKMSLEYRRKHYHTHGMDVTLIVGGSQGGKTGTAIAVIVDACLTVPGTKALIGALHYEDMKDTIIEELKELFSIDSEWDNPMVTQVPNDRVKFLRFWNGSYIRLFPFKDFKRLRGKRFDIAFLDEASQIPEPAQFYEMPRRMTEQHLKIKQIILTTNLPENPSHWLFPAFKLHELGYGTKKTPIGEACKCQYCIECLDMDDHGAMQGEEVLYVDGVCPECGDKKTTECDGGQHWFRVIQCDASMNDTIDGKQYLMNVKGTQDEMTFRRYALGDVTAELRQGKIWKGYSSLNVLQRELPLDEKKPLIWTFDFNISYNCSVIVQSLMTPKGLAGIALDEIVIPEEGPEAVVKEFVRRYPYFRPKIYLNGDPNGLNKTNDRNERHKFQIIYDYLTEKGYDVELLVKKEKGHTLIPVATRIDQTNTLFCDANGLRRLFLNPGLLYLQSSLESSRYREGGDKAVDVDKTSDKVAAKLVTKYPDKTTALSRGMDPDKFTVPCLSHPSEALSYWVAQALKALERGIDLQYFHILGEGIQDMQGQSFPRPPVKTLTEQYEEQVDLEYQEYLRAGIASPEDDISVLDIFTSYF
jgi:hypothetical protein